MPAAPGGMSKRHWVRVACLKTTGYEWRRHSATIGRDESFPNSAHTQANVCANVYAHVAVRKVSPRHKPLECGTAGTDACSRTGNCPMEFGCLRAIGGDVSLAMLQICQTDVINSGLHGGINRSAGWYKVRMMEICMMVSIGLHDGINRST